MIRFGPAAAPRWFDQNLARLPDYLDLIAAAGGRAVEFVVLPGTGSAELGRVHVFERDVAAAIDLAHQRNFTVNLHAPLPPSFHISEWASDRRSYASRFAPIGQMLARAGQGQSMPPVLVMHAGAGRPELTADFLLALFEVLGGVAPEARISLELRARADADDARFDRNLATLGDFVGRLGTNRLGICWDVAHEWENTGKISQLTLDQVALINHVHIHDSRPSGEVHGPLGYGDVPWQCAIRQLRDLDWQGAITLEIRYRYATERGDPWSVLTQNLMAVSALLAGE